MRGFGGEDAPEGEPFMSKLSIAMIAALSLTPLAPQVQAAAAVTTKKPVLSPETFKGMELRGIGPAMKSGRIADVAIHPSDPNVWYVGAGSGGVWKTTNAGTTWKPVFDEQGAYSIGCVTVDPANPNIVWVGTGENVGGRHVGFGDGLYRSADGGVTWEKRGLERSEHLSKIVVHPTLPDTLWVAAQGPLWSKGGERGLFRTTDGGKSWSKTLAGGDWTGVTDLVIDPRDPNRLWAATWQRQRSVAAYLGGGPESAIHASVDGGLTWTKLGGGLPTGNLGKIGLAISPQRPDVLYAAIELERRTGAVYRSADRGASWKKMSDTVAGGTGPHYYQELYADPHRFDRIYLVDVRLQRSDDGGGSFRSVPEEFKHSDNHSIQFRADDPDYLLVGTDGGLYETFDGAASWRFVANLPVTQFYKIALDDEAPFYNIYGGTQDNSTQGGPVRTDSQNGIRNDDWWITLFADGHQPATEPGNPDILYSEWQEGNLVRVDRTTGEVVYITPQGEPGEAPDRFNWDSPILVSPHQRERLYYASQRVWRSDDRGDSWRPISGDLTHQGDRLQIPLLGRKWSWEAAWDLGAMSAFGTISSLAESPKVEGLLYAGTDDGRIQVSENGGGTWRAVDVGSLPGVPAQAFVNDIKADLFDADTVYVALDHHKSGDFKPYLLKSSDRGRSWKSIAGDLPDRHLVWRLVQDHVRPELLFAGTEFGLFFTVDGGAQWIELQGGMPTIALRDLAIQRRENDLVAASFGRGIFVLDDYSALREASEQSLSSGAQLFAPRKAWWYVERRTLAGEGPGDYGHAHFVAPNPPFGAVFTYHLAESRSTRAERRKETERPKIEAGEDTPFPPFAELEAERREPSPAMVLTVRNAAGEVVRRLIAPATKGFHRVAWDLRRPATDAISSPPGKDSTFTGALAPPGRYTVTLAERIDGVETTLAGPVTLEVERLRQGALPGASPEAAAAFLAEVEEMNGRVSAAQQALDRAIERVELLAHVLARSIAAPELEQERSRIRQELWRLDERLRGNRSRGEVAVASPPTIGGRLGVAQFGTQFSTYGPTPTHRRALAIAASELAAWKSEFARLAEQELPALEQRLDAADVPWTPGRALP